MVDALKVIRNALKPYSEIRQLQPNKYAVTTTSTLPNMDLLTVFVTREDSGTYTVTDNCLGFACAVTNGADRRSAKDFAPAITDRTGVEFVDHAFTARGVDRHMLGAAIVFVASCSQRLAFAMVGTLVNK